MFGEQTFAPLRTGLRVIIFRFEQLQKLTIIML